MRNEFLIGDALKKMMEHNNYKNAAELANEMLKHGLLNYDPDYFDENITLKEKKQYYQRSINNHLNNKACSSMWLERYQAFFNCSYDFLFGLISQPTHNITDIHEATGLSRVAIEKLQSMKLGNSATSYCDILSFIIENDTFIELLKAIKNKSDKELLNKAYGQSIIDYVVNGADLTLISSNGEKHQGSGHSVLLFDSLQAFEVALDLRINKLFHNIIDNITN